MTVWIYEMGEGEYEEVAVVENGTVTSGDEEWVEATFDDGIPDDEEQVARTFNSTVTPVSTDFEMDFTPEEPPDERGMGGTGNAISLEEFESWMDTIHENMVCGEETSKALTQYSESQLPQMVKNRLRDAILGDAIFGQIDSIPSGKRMQLRNYMVEELDQDGWSIDGLANRLQDLEVGLSQSEAETIARTETQSAVNHAAESAYETMEEERDTEFKFKWVGSIDDRTTDACIWLLEQTNPNHGGSPVTLERLKELIQEAPEHDDDINTQAREFTPHINCRKRYVRVVE